MSMNPHIRRNN